MSVHKKLMDARIALHAQPLNKSGWNDFSKYSYFELGDFLPATLKLFHESNLCGLVTYDNEIARLTITDLDDGTELVVTSPMATASLKGAHDIQNLGAVQTYMRRYLWVTAMEIIENDFLDHVHDKNKAAKPAAPAAKPAAAPAKPAPAKPAERTTAGKDAEWQIKLTEQEGSDWAGAVMDATELALKLAKSSEDVQNIYRVNKVHYERIKEEKPEVYADLLAKLSKTKASFTQE